MLLVTDQAASVLRDILGRDDVEGNAIRLAPEVLQDGSTQIALQAIVEPRAADAPTQAEGVDVFVAPELASDLENSVIDAEREPTGDRLVVRPAS